MKEVLKNYFIVKSNALSRHSIQEKRLFILTESTYEEEDIHQFFSKFTKALKIVPDQIDICFVNKSLNDFSISSIEFNKDEKIWFILFGRSMANLLYPLAFLPYKWTQIDNMEFILAADPHTVAKSVKHKKALWSAMKNKNIA